METMKINSKNCCEKGEEMKVKLDKIVFNLSATDHLFMVNFYITYSSEFITTPSVLRITHDVNEPFKSELEQLWEEAGITTLPIEITNISDYSPKAQDVLNRLFASAMEAAHVPMG